MQSGPFSPPPAAPPIKKQRSSQTPDHLSLQADQAIQRRRAELEKLKQMTRTGPTKTLDKARSQLDASGPPPTRYPATTMRGGGRPGPPPTAGGATATPHTARKAPPPPPPETVARRLDGSFEAYQGRSKSAPPSRPPPPPPPQQPSPPKEAPEMRGHMSRPDPVAPAGVAAPTTGAPPSTSATPPTTSPGKRAVKPTVSPRAAKPTVGPLAPPLGASLAPPTVSPAATKPTISPGEIKPAAVSPATVKPTVSPGTAKATISPGGAAAAPPSKVSFFQPQSPVADMKQQSPVAAPTMYPSAGQTPFHPPPLTTEKETPEETAGDRKAFAGHTPFPGRAEPTTSNAGHTPFHPTVAKDKTPAASPMSKEPPSTTRRELLRDMRAYADTPKKGKPVSSEKSTDLQQGMAEPEKEKTDASMHAAALLGDVPKPAETNKHVNFLSPVASVKSPRLAAVGSPMVSPGPRRRTATPHPKRHVQNDADDQVYLKEAAECIPYEYVSDIATFTVRRPFGLAVERDLWFSVGHANSKMYARNANVTSVSTLEVVAKIDADQSVFSLHGDAIARHRVNPQSPWKEFGNVDEREQLLGSVMYIDHDANEQEYSLDEIFEGAQTVREHYCSSILSTAAGLRVRKETQPASLGSPVPHQQPLGHQPSFGQQPSVQQLQQPPTAEPDAAPGNTQVVREQPAAAPAQASTKRSEPKKEKKSPPPPTPEEGDVLSTFIGLFFSAIYGAICFVFITLPMRILLTTSVLACSVILLNFLWLYVADDHGATTMGASMSMYNRPGIM